MSSRFPAKRMAVLAVGALLAATASQGYYHFVHFASRYGPFEEIPLKFDLTALTNKTLYYFISDQGPGTYNGNDNLNAVVSEIQAAAEVWSSVATSNIRLAFGGFQAAGSTGTTPGIDVVFSSDIPPGLLELAGPTVPPINSSFNSASLAAVNGRNFVPILRSTLIMNRDLSQQSASFTEAFFTTLVHEFGHTLGLQHSMSSSAMSTQVTRGTTKAAPLGPDDVAGLSLLYPAGSFGKDSGTITGQVTLDGTGVGLASVVAISPSGAVIGSLTNPDGTYRIDGVPPGQYYVYTHPLPPAYSGQASPADIRPPVDSNGKEIPAGPTFDTIFYPDTKDWAQATPVFVQAGANTDGIDFSVQPRQSVNIYAVQTYGFFDRNPVKSPPLLVGSSNATIYTSGFGLAPDSVLPAGLKVSAIGGAVPLVPDSLKIYSLATDPPYLQMSFAPSSGSGPRHLTFTLNGELYVLPVAFKLRQNPPPVIDSVTPAVDGAGNGAVLITGSNLSAETRILFEGAPARVLKRNADGSLLAAPPPAPGGYTANVVALNRDGQSSLFVQELQPPTYTYDTASQPTIVISPNSLPAGSEAVVDVLGANTNFIDGVTSLGLGSSDIAVRRVWVLSPTHLIANVSVRPSAAVGSTNLTVLTGLQSVSVSAGFQVAQANARAITMIPPVLSAGTGSDGTPAGRTALVNATNLPASGLSLTVGGRTATILSTDNGRIAFQVPVGTPTGPAILKLQDADGDSIFPVVMHVSPPPPAITGAFIGGSGLTVLDKAHPASPGSIVTLAVSGLDDSVVGSPQHLRVTVNGVVEKIIGLNSAGPQNSSVLVQFILDPATQAGTIVPVVISLDSNPSAAFPIPVQSL